jgi:uncharacterized protein (DUF4415 family)
MKADACDAYMLEIATEDYMQRLANDDELMQQLKSHVTSMWFFKDNEAVKTYCEDLIKTYITVRIWKELNEKYEPKMTAWTDRLNDSLVGYLESMV